MQCPRCDSKMIFSQLVTREELGIAYLAVTTARQECPKCSATVTVSLPTFYIYPKEVIDET